MYVSYRGTHSICKYSLRGEFLEEYGGSKGSALGQFNGTLVSGTDSERALIVCDCYNNRVQVKSREGEWKQYNLNGVSRIADVVIVGKYLFVLHGQWKKQQLSMYHI